jgi:hypothetical protein
VPYNAIFTFKIKIIKTKNKDIMIGVVDEPKQRNQRNSYNSNNAVCYYGIYGRKYPSSIIEGNGFSGG